MMTFKKYCEENNLDQNKALEIVVSSDEGVLHVEPLPAILPSSPIRP